MVIDGWNLFAAASAGGNLTVMRWLAEAVAPLGWLGRICASHGVTEARNEIENVMLVACFNGHLEIVKYLSASGAADIFMGMPRAGYCQLAEACSRGQANLDVTVWLMVQGASNGPNGHASAATLEDVFMEDESRELLPAVRTCLARLIIGKCDFWNLVLTAVRFAPSSPLAVFRGHEATLLGLVQDFAGVVRGREFRNAWEVWGVLLSPADRKCTGLM